VVSGSVRFSPARRDARYGPAQGGPPAGRWASACSVRRPGFEPSNPRLGSQRGSRNAQDPPKPAERHIRGRQIRLRASSSSSSSASPPCSTSFFFHPHFLRPAPPFPLTTAAAALLILTPHPARLVLLCDSPLILLFFTVLPPFFVAEARGRAGSTMMHLRVQMLRRRFSTPCLDARASPRAWHIAMHLAAILLPYRHHVRCRTRLQVALL